MNAQLKKLLITSFAAGTILFTTQAATVGVDPSKTWLGYVNVFELPANGGGYLWGSTWAPADLPATFSGTTLTIGPNVNTYNSTDAYWVQANGQGNKQMDASFYIEDASLAGSPITFSGNVLANTLVAPYTTTAFIKEFTPTYSLVGQSTAALVGGSTFEVNYTAAAGNIVQYGFETVGPNANPATVASLGSVQIAAVPEPGTFGLAVVGLAMLGFLRKTN